MYTFGIALGAVISIAIFYWLATRFKEKFGRNFIVTGTGASLFLGEICFVIGLFILVDQGVTIDGAVSELVLDLITFSVTVTPDMDPVMIDIGSGMLAFGSLLFLLSWAINILASGFVWGMTQSIFQTIIAAVLGVIIAIAAIFFLDRKNKKN